MSTIKGVEAGPGVLTPAELTAGMRVKYEPDPEDPRFMVITIRTFSPPEPPGQRMRTIATTGEEAIRELQAFCSSFVAAAMGQVVQTDPSVLYEPAPGAS